MPPAFWELQAGETSVGCTVHTVEAGLDTGDIILERSVPVDRFSTVSGMQTKLNRVGVELVCEAVAQVLDGSATRTPQAAGGQYQLAPDARCRRGAGARQCRARTGRERRCQDRAQACRVFRLWFAVQAGCSTTGTA